MNQQMYQQIKETIEREAAERMGHLDALAAYMGTFNTKNPLKPVKKALESPRRSINHTLGIMPLNGTSTPQIEAGKYLKKLVPCEFKDCQNRVNPERPKCEVCGKHVCSRHQRDKKLCSECKKHGE